MSRSGDRSLIGDLAYRVGYAVGDIQARLDEAAIGFGFGTDRGDPETGGAGTTGPARRAPGSDAPVDGHAAGPGPAQRADTRDGGSDADGVEPLLVQAAERWLLSRLLRPRSVRWPLVILAGLGATALYDLARRFESPVAIHEDPEAMAVRYMSGIVTASAYASVFYPRIPGDPVARGVLFGVLNAAAAPYGGVLALGKRLLPSLDFPLRSFAVDREDDAGPASHIAFGLGLGLLYRDGGALDPGSPEDELEDESLPAQ